MIGLYRLINQWLVDLSLFAALHGSSLCIKMTVFETVPREVLLSHGFLAFKIVRNVRNGLTTKILRSTIDTEFWLGKSVFDRPTGKIDLLVKIYASHVTMLMTSWIIFLHQHYGQET